MKQPVLKQQQQHGLWRCLQFAARGLLMAGLLAGMPMLAMAQPQGQSGQNAEQVGPVNQEQALERVRANFPGTVISINEVRQNGRLRYRVRLDNEGNIYTVFVDQATGELSRE
ncbi:MAG: hypothetical protein CMQ34_14800 [Gammaproteobacteria bacterium]|nr:hypothetical protein [Gammaproteobacteria bacterium]|tara:strand:- start:227 stop:565 length:339 start_codon:yes stop_codon:yes gene_type:complete